MRTTSILSDTVSPADAAAPPVPALRLPAPRYGSGAEQDALAGRTEAMLAAHVPLTLLLDLADPDGPHSDDLLHDEPGSSDWLRRT